MFDFFFLLVLILAWLLAFAVMRGVFLPLLATPFYRRLPIRTHPEVAAPTAVVTLIHGTFARGAPWTLPGSALCTELREILGNGVQLRRFEWSGANSFRGRKTAALALENDLAAVRQRWPGVPHYCIGHSHGGNVALDAAAQAGADALDGLVCLATPVLTVRLRQFTRREKRMIGIGFFLVLALPFVQLSQPDTSLSDFGTIMVLMAFPGAWLWFRFARRMAIRVCEGVNYRVLDPERTVFIRSPFDEASGAIGLANVVSWAVSRLTAGPFRFVDGFDKIDTTSARVKHLLGYLALALAGALVLGLTGMDVQPVTGYKMADQTILTAFSGLFFVSSLGAVLSAFMPLVRFIQNHRFGRWLLAPIYFYVMFIGALLFVPAIVVMSITHALAMGVEMLVCSVLVETTAEPCPPGNWTLFQLRPPPESGLRHSSVYESPVGLAALHIAMRGIRQPGPAPLVSYEPAAADHRDPASARP